MNRLKKHRIKLDFLLSPMSMLIGVIIGVAIGIFRPNWVPIVAPVGKIYLSILKMCIVPILLTAISLNIGRLIQSNLGSAYLKKIFIITFIMLSAMCLIGIIAAVIFQPGYNLSQETLAKLGTIVNGSKYAPDLEIELEKPILIALTTQTSLACIPSGLSAMTEGFSLDKRVAGLLVPLGFTLFRFGNILYFAIAGLFVAQLYYVQISLESLIIIFISSIFAGIATAGTSGILTLTMLSIVIEPIGLPLDAVLVLFIVIDPIIDPFRTLCTVHTNLVNTFMVVMEKQVNTSTNYISS
jgi:Na+/H+-dicarboxylate symporter